MPQRNRPAQGPGAGPKKSGAARMPPRFEKRWMTDLELEEVRNLDEGAARRGTAGRSGYRAVLREVLLAIGAVLHDRAGRAVELRAPAAGSRAGAEDDV